MAVKTILVVDDEEQILKFMKEMFEPRGYSVLGATNGNEALKALASEAKVDLMLLDLNLPGMSGVDVLRRLKAKAHPPKVVVLTALGGLREKLEGIGCDAFIEKPFDMEELAGVVNQLLGGKGFESAKPAPGEIPSCRILVVDDEQDIADFTATFLKEGLPGEDRRTDFEVEVAYSGDEALEKAQKIPCDIALVDIKLERGSMWGGELIQRLKALPKPPVGFVIISAVDSEKQRSIAKQFPDYPIFEKPMSIEHLMNTVRRICFKHKLTKKVSVRKA